MHSAKNQLRILYILSNKDRWLVSLELAPVLSETEQVKDVKGSVGCYFGCFCQILELIPPF